MVEDQRNTNVTGRRFLKNNFRLAGKSWAKTCKVDLEQMTVLRGEIAKTLKCIISLFTTVFFQ